MVPMWLVAVENNHLNRKVRRVVHRSKRQGDMVGRLCVRAKDRAAAARAKCSRHLGTAWRLIPEFTKLALNDHVIPWKHRANGMTCPAKPSAFFAMTLRHDNRRTLNGIADGTTGASARIGAVRFRTHSLSFGRAVRQKGTGSRPPGHCQSVRGVTGFRPRFTFRAKIASLSGERPSIPRVARPRQIHTFPKGFPT